MAISQSASNVLLQLADVLDRMTDKQYNTPIELLSDTTIGAHVRHTIEFFTCLLEGVEQSVINYDLRRRDMVLETDRISALQKATELAEKLSDLKMKGQITLESKIGNSKGKMVSMASSLERELWYTIEHAVHHLAIIKIGLKSIDSSFVFPEHFGVASSTVNYQLSKG